jgi:hypothetical protein
MLRKDWLIECISTKGGKAMKKGINWSFIGVFLIAGLLVVNLSQAEEAKITVLNPRGQPPSIPLVPMALRLDTLDGKTVYFIDVGFPGTNTFIHEMMAWFAKNRPNVKTEFRAKAGSMHDDDPKLWAEIKEKGNAVVMGVGH